MRTFFRYIVRKTWKPLVEKYLSRERQYYYKGIRLKIPPEVFHPGFFFSTRFLLNYLRRYPLHHKTFLEPGAGSGLMSIFAAKQGAFVTATDINPVAIQYLHKNSRLNSVSLQIIESDLFQNIPEQAFDFIAINPPYYRKKPVSAKDYAWYCGENGEFFSALFRDIKKFMHPETLALMVLFEGCDINMIQDLAARHGCRLICVHRKQYLLEKNFIFKIETGG